MVEILHSEVSSLRMEIFVAACYYRVAKIVIQIVKSEFFGERLLAQARLEFDLQM